MVVPSTCTCNSSSAIMSNSTVVIKITIARSVKKKTADQFYLNSIRALK